MGSGGSEGASASSGPRSSVLIAALSLVTLTVAVLQTAVVPVLGVIAHLLNASSVAVSWAVTANLLAAAASTPLTGRLADVHNKKRVLLGVLAIVLVGSVLAAETSSLALLIVARALQGVSYSLYPISVAILRNELPEASSWVRLPCCPERLASAAASASS
jgi:MFS family permease